VETDGQFCISVLGGNNVQPPVISDTFMFFSLASNPWHMIGFCLRANYSLKISTIKNNKTETENNIQ